MRRFAWWQRLVALAVVAALAIQWLVGWALARSAVASVAAVGVAALGRVVWWTWPVFLGALALWQGPRVARRLRQGTTAMERSIAATGKKARQRGLLVPVALGVLLLGALVVASAFVLPNVMVPAEITPSPERLVELRNSVRGTFIQVAGGLLLVIGAVATWWQVHINREGHITDRYTRAVEQLGAADNQGQEKVDVQLGGIYALERLAHDSPDDQATIAEVLTAFVRQRATSQQPHDGLVLRRIVRWALRRRESPEIEPGHAGSAEPLQTRLPAVQAAMTILGRMPRPADVRLNLFGVDLRGLRLWDATLTRADLADANLTDAILAGTNLAHANCREATLIRAYLGNADLTRAHLRNANLTYAFLDSATLSLAGLAGADLTHALLDRANLTLADLAGANLTDVGLMGANLTDAVLGGATLTRAHLGNANLTDADLEGTTLSEARANSATRWPEGFDPQAAGVVVEEGT